MMKNWAKKNMELLAIAVSLCFLGIGSVLSWDNVPVMGWDKLCGDILIVLCCCVLIRKTGLWKDAGFQKAGFGRGMVYGIPFLLIGVGSVFVSNAGVDLTKLEFISLPNALLFTANMLLVGANEEIWMRSFILNGLVNKYGKDRNNAWKAIIVSALIFGAVHLPNIAFVHPVTLGVQVINAAAGGVLFGVMYLRSGNIWAGILVHAAVDWLGLFIGNCFSGADTVLTMEMTLGQGIVIAAMGAIPPVLISLYLMRRYGKETARA